MAYRRFGIEPRRPQGHRQGPNQGRQDKSAASGRAHVVGWIGDFRRLAIRPAGVFAQNANDFNVPSAISLIGESAPGHDDAGRRLQSAPRPNPSRQPGRQATEELRRRSDAGREEGGPPRPDVRAKRQDCGPLDLRPRTAAALSLPLARQAGASSSWPGSCATVAAVFVLRRCPSTSPISNARASPATARTPGCSTRLPTTPTRRLSPSGARRTGIISGSRCRPRMRARWPTFAPSLAN